MKKIKLEIKKDVISLYAIFYNDEETIEIKFIGETKNQNINKDYLKTNNIKTTLEDFVTNHNHKDMIENIKIIRTILRDFEEVGFSISYYDEHNEEYVLYGNKILKQFEQTKREKTKQNYQYKITYNCPYGINIKYNDKELDKPDYEKENIITDEITKIIRKIYNLKKNKSK